MVIMVDCPDERFRGPEGYGVLGIFGSLASADAMDGIVIRWIFDV